MTVAIVGLGLIGGSLAKAFSERTAHRVIGFDRNPEVTQAALACGAIHEVGEPAGLSRADLIYLCIYPHAAVQFVKEQFPFFKKGVIVTDTAGIKTEICGELSSLARTHGFVFAGSHPMAGKEQSGFGASEAGLFDGASYLLAPCEAPEEALALLSETALQLGFGGVKRTTPEEHDRMIAFTSQLPHALACAYVLSPQCPNHKGFSAGSYRDVSRVARINEELWSELFLENREPLTAEMNELIRHLEGIRAAIQNNDKDALREILRCGRQIKEALDE